MRTHSSFAAVAPAVLAACGSFTTALGQTASLVPIVALPGLTQSSLPPSSPRDGQFEMTSIPAGTSLANPGWGSWQFTTSSGIAHETSSIAAGNGPSPNGGDYVAYIAGQGTITITVNNLAAGLWRLRYQLAARSHSGILDPQEVQIVGGSQVIAQEQQLSRAYQQFMTRPFQVNTGVTQTFFFAGTGTPADIALLDNVVLEPVREWGVANNWNPAIVPGPGNPVQIPVGSVIAIKTNANAADIEVDGELIVPDTVCSLTAASVMVMGDTARFEVGRRKAPFAASQSFTLTLTGPYTTTNSKFLMAMDGGTIEMHGAPKTSWTRLVATANPLAMSIQVADATGWNIGDEIVIAGSQGQAIPGIASTGFQDFSEQRTLSGISGNTLQLSMPLARLHVSSSIPYPTTGTPRWTLEQHAEVGMLTHNVKVTSIPVPVPNTSGHPETGFGGHIMIMGSLTMMPGRGFLSAVELDKLGQTKQLGRYPMHWHMCRDDAAGQYIVDSSIHETFNRALTIHGTDGILAEGNVALHNLGHAFFLEDGSEEDNVLRNNLVIGTLKPAMSHAGGYDDAVIPSDNEFDQFQNRTPSAFWITNPRNTIVGNVASDTIGTGFWLIFPEQVLGLSNPATGPSAIPHNYLDAPNTLDLTEFRDNTAHCCRQGLDVHDGIVFGTNHVQTNFSWAPRSGSALLENFVAYSCDSGIYTGDGDSGGDIIFDRTLQADNIIGARFASGDIIQDSLFVADTGNGLYAPGSLPAASKELEAYRVYDGAPTVTGSHFFKYNLANMSRVLSSNGASMRRTNHRFVSMTFEPALPRLRVKFDDFSLNPGGGTGSQADAQSPDDPRSWGFSVWDPMGTISGTGTPSSIIGNHPFMLDGSETAYVNGPSDPSNAFFTPRKFGHLFVREPGAAGNLHPINFLRTKTGVTTQQFLNDYVIDQQKQVPVILDNGYLYGLSWPGGLPPSVAGQAELLVQVGNVDTDDAVMLMLAIQQPNLSVTLGGAPVAVATGLGQIRQTPPGGTPLMFIDASGNLYLRVMNAPADAFFELNW